jgi:hypothetical protein
VSRLPRTGSELYLDTLRVKIDATEVVRRARAEAASYRAGRDSVAAYLASTRDTSGARAVRQHMHEFPAFRLRMPTALVRATLDCVVDAASRSRIPIRFVVTTVLGDSALAKLSRTVPVPRRALHEREREYTP